MISNNTEICSGLSTVEHYCYLYLLLAQATNNISDNKGKNYNDSK